MRLVPNRSQRTAIAAALFLSIPFLSFQNFSFVPDTRPLRPVTLPVTFPADFSDSAERAAEVSPEGTGPLEFDPFGNAYYRNGDILFKKYPDGRTESLNFKTAANKAIQESMGATKWLGSPRPLAMFDRRVVFDAAGNAYTIANASAFPDRPNVFLLFSRDGAVSWKAFRLPGLSARLEARDTFNDRAVPPSVLSYDTYVGMNHSGNLWLNTFTLDAQAGLKVETPVLVSENSILTDNHSGGGNSSFTRKGMIMVVYPSDEIPDGGFGTNAYVRAYDVKAKTFTGESLFLGISGDLGCSTTKLAADNHNIPAITMDKYDYVHVILGAHHCSLKYTAIKGFDIYKEWRTLAVVGDKVGAFTYVSLNADKNSNLHIYTRTNDEGFLWKLVHIKKIAGVGWYRWPENGGKIYRPVTAPMRQFYGAWRQHVSVDGTGNLYLNFTYAPNDLTRDEVAQISAEAGINRATLNLATPGCDFASARGRCLFKNPPDLHPTTLKTSDYGQTYSYYGAGK